MRKLNFLLVLAFFSIAAAAPTPALSKGDMQSVPMLRQSMKPGTTISESDIVMVPVERKWLNTQSVRQASDIVGMAARRPLSAGRQLRLSDFETPAVVRKGSRVTMVLSAGALRVTALGTAMEDGSDNAFIKVRNSESNQMVHGRVLAPNLVEVLPVGQLALR